MGLSGGAIAGIVVGCVVFVAAKTACKAVLLPLPCHVHFRSLCTSQLHTALVQSAFNHDWRASLRLLLCTDPVRYYRYGGVFPVVVP